MAEPGTRGDKISRFPQGLCVVDAERFKQAVWNVERENFRPGDALDAFERAVVDVEAERERPQAGDVSPTT